MSLISSFVKGFQSKPDFLPLFIPLSAKKFSTSLNISSQVSVLAIVSVIELSSYHSLSYQYQKNCLSGFRMCSTQAETKWKVIYPPFKKTEQGLFDETCKILSVHYYVPPSSTTCQIKSLSKFQNIFRASKNGKLGLVDKDGFRLMK